MKPSYYNVLARVDEGSLLYNTNSQALVRLDESETIWYELLVKGYVARAEELVDEETRESLTVSGFLVDDPEAEARLMLYRHNVHRNNAKAFELTISPTRVCNYDCDYCYIKKRPGVMSEDVQDALMRFVETRYEQTGFKTFRAVWYGGEPLLAIEVIEALSARFIAFCEEHGVRYMAHMLTNGSLANREMCRRLTENCRLTTIMPTISGNGDMHDWQRTPRDGVFRFDTLMRNIDYMLESGLTVHANFVVNHNNFEECKNLAASLSKKPGVVIRLTRTFAYGSNCFELHDEAHTELKVFTRAEFASYYLEFYRALGMNAAEYRDVLKPIPLYCAAWHNGSFFIDEIGDMFKCMMDMDVSVNALANVVDLSRGDASFNWDRFAQFNKLEPARSPKCRSCCILPVCQGGCAYCSAIGDDVCHDLRGRIEDFVRDYYQASIDG